MPDGLFTQRPSNPPPVDLDALVRETLEFVHPEDGPNLPVVATWRIEDRDAPWPTLVISGECWTADGTREPWSLVCRLPSLRAFPEQVRTQAEKACVDVLRLVAERSRLGYTFETAHG